jgi:hypothetical protein
MNHGSRKAQSVQFTNDIRVSMQFFWQGRREKKTTLSDASIHEVMAHEERTHNPYPPPSPPRALEEFIS